MTRQALADFRQVLIAELSDPILCIDAGARWGADQAFLALKNDATIFCFDPDAAECARLQAMEPGERVHYVPLALSADGRTLDLHVTREPACSSVYPPDPYLHANYPGLGIIEPVALQQCNSVTVDHFLGDGQSGPLAWMKLDTQGSELDILRGSVANLPTVCMIDIEVEFNPLYLGQPVFSDVDQFLRAQGFSLWRLPLLAHYSVGDLPDAHTPVRSDSSPRDMLQTSHPGNGQLFWAQAHYVRTDCLPAHRAMPERQLALKTALIASAYGYWDLTLMALGKRADTAAFATALQALLAQGAG
jgi:FkbM family methyltransferase